MEEKDPDNRNGFGRTPLSYATGNGNAQLVELLLGYNVDINSKCDGEMTPLSRAIEGGSVPVLQILLARGVKIDQRYSFVSTSNHT